MIGHPTTEAKKKEDVEMAEADEEPEGGGGGLVPY